MRRWLRFMPATDVLALGDDDVAALYAQISTLPPVERTLPQTSIGPLGRLLYLFDQVPVLLTAERIDHASASAPKRAPAAAVTLEFGAYLARTCTGCHGERSSGGPLAGAPPNLPAPANLTPHANGLAGWTESDSLRAMREGKRPDGRAIDPFMPWATFAKMTDIELGALRLYLSSLPSLETGSG
jgi:mono/diheme cytochrome c family protein